MAGQEPAVGLDPMSGAFLKSVAFGLLVQLRLAVWGWLPGSALPGRSRRRSISLAGAAGVLAFGLVGLFSSI